MEGDTLVPELLNEDIVVPITPSTGRLANIHLIKPQHFSPILLLVITFSLSLLRNLKIAISTALHLQKLALCMNFKTAYKGRQ